MALIGRAVESVKLRESSRRAKQRDEKLEAEEEEEERKAETKKAEEKKRDDAAKAKLKPQQEGKEGKVRKRDNIWASESRGWD